MRQFSFLTIDLEDWFHLLDLEQVMNVGDWDSYEARIENITFWMLELLSEYNVKAIFFVLGWVADRYPDLILEIRNRGHVIGSHSYSHPLLYQLSADEFRQDLVKSLTSIERACGEVPKYYRAPGFSITQNNLSCLKTLIENGIEADFSIFPGLRSHGGLPTALDVPHRITFDNEKSLIEFPMSVGEILLGWKFGFGGGYYRLLPRRILRDAFFSRGYLMSYFHPRDFDFYQPRLSELGWLRYFRSYVGLKHSKSKFKSLLGDFSFGDPQSQISEIAGSELQEVLYHSEGVNL